MPRAHDGEVPVVECGQLRLTQPLDDREYGGIDEAHAQVGVGGKQLSDASIVGRTQILDEEMIAIYLVEHSRELIDEERLRAPVLELNQDRGGNHSSLSSSIQ